MLSPMTDMKITSTKWAQAQNVCYNKFVKLRYHKISAALS